MPLVNAQNYRVRARGVCDTLDGGNVAPGAMSALTNLVFDQATPFSLQCRAAATIPSSFPGFSSPGVVSAAKVIGSRVYGMIATARNAGKDEPFCYDIPSNTFITVTGVVAGNCPTTQPTSGAWTPPTMDATGIYVVVTHPGFPGGAGNYFGWFDITNPAAPAWNAGNTTTNALPGVPTSVIQFNSRLYFAVSNQVWFTAALTLSITNASDQLVIGNSDAITTLAPLSLTTTTQGVLQAIVVFKANKIAQITGDKSASTLAVNDLPGEVGTSAPRSVVPTPSGVRFMANDGLRTVRIDGFIDDPHPDIRMPFIYAATPSRCSAAYGDGVYRICVQNTFADNQPFQEWWLDDVRGGWTGPHTFRQDLVLQYGSTFVAFDTSHPGKMYLTDATPSATSSYVENGSGLSYVYQTAPLPDGDTVYQNSAVIVAIDMVLPVSLTGTTFVASDVYTGALSTASIFPPSTPVLWGAVNWGESLWYGQNYGLKMFQIPFDKTLVFQKLILRATGDCNNALRLGSFRVAYQRLGYVPQ